MIFFGLLVPWHLATKSGARKSRDSSSQSTEAKAVDRTEASYPA